MLEAIDLHCERGERSLFTALSFQVKPGEWLQIAGRNGAGKTTLLRMLSGLIVPDSGEVRWQGEPLAQVRESEGPLIWLGHRPGVRSKLTVRENLQMFCPRQSIADYRQALNSVGLTEQENSLVGQLSAGQQRRVSLARLWLTTARLWILDEPFTAIDAAGVRRLMQHLQRHIELGGMVVMTSHQTLAAVGEVRYLNLEEPDVVAVSR